MKKEVFKFLALLLIAIGSGPASGAFWQWSKTPSANGNSDPSISWVEGMPPSVVNDSARAMMSRLAEQAADTSGQLVTAGGPTAYTVTTNQGFPSPPNDGQVIGVTFNVASSGNPTLSADGGAAAPILSAPATPAGVVQSIPYSLIYNAASSSWLVRGGSSSGGVPLGGILPFTGTVVPSSSYVFANGQCISTTTYAIYWALVGNPGPGPCGAGNFQVIDLRGYVLAGLDTMAGSAAAGRLTSVATGCGTSMTNIGAVCANGRENHTQQVTEIAAHYHVAGISDPGHSHTIPFADQGFKATTDVVGFNTVTTSATTTTSTVATGVRVNSSNGLDTTYSQGNSTPFPVVQPTIGLNYLIRVL